MKLLILLLISITGIVLVAMNQQADAKLLPDGVYLLQGNGFVITQDSIEDSELNFQFLSDKARQISRIFFAKINFLSILG